MLDYVATLPIVQIHVRLANISIVQIHVRFVNLPTVQSQINVPRTVLEVIIHSFSVVF